MLDHCRECLSVSQALGIYIVIGHDADLAIVGAAIELSLRPEKSGPLWACAWKQVMNRGQGYSASTNQFDSTYG